MSRLWFSALFSLAFFWTTLVFAHDVVLLQPLNPSPSTDELLARLKGELSSVGFDVIGAVSTAGEDEARSEDREELRRVVHSTDAEAVIQVLAGDSAPKIRIFTIDSRHGHELSRIAFSPDEGSPNQLAIRASEVLRSRLLEPGLAGRRVPAPVRPSPPAAPPPSVENRRPRLGLELGAAALIGFDEVGPALAPLVRFDFRLDAPFVLQATAAGFGTRPTITAAAGSARVAQQFALLGARTRTRGERFIQPFIALSGGVLRTAVDGFAATGGEGRSPSQWSFLIDAGVGTSLELGRRYELTLETHLQLAEPHVVIHFLDEAVASSGRPNLVMTLAVGAWP